MIKSVASRYLKTITAALCLATAAIPNGASAMNIQPLVIDMATAGKDSKSSVRVVNDGAAPLPVEFEISRLELDARGETLQKSSGEEFLVFPPQAMIAPGATQVFRVQWTGEAAPPKSQSYIFSVNQLPVKPPQGSSGVQVVFNFSVVVNVAPPGSQAMLRQVKSDIASDGHGKRGVTLVVENSGNMHGYLSDATLVLESGSWHKIISGAEMRTSLGLGLVQPGKQRRFLVPVEVPSGISQISSKLEYVPKQTK